MNIPPHLRARNSASYGFSRHIVGARKHVGDQWHMVIHPPETPTPPHGGARGGGTGGWGRRLLAFWILRSRFCFCGTLQTVYSTSN